MPIPPRSDQERIVAEVERRLSINEELTSEVEVNLKRAERLHQSILQCAFSGTLLSKKLVGAIDCLPQSAAN